MSLMNRYTPRFVRQIEKDLCQEIAYNELQVAAALLHAEARQVYMVQLSKGSNHSHLHIPGRLFVLPHL